MQKDIFLQNNVTYIDYKDAAILRTFLNAHGRIKSRRQTGLSARSQRMLGAAIKRARFMGFLPYVIK